MSEDPQPLAFSPGSITCFFYVDRGDNASTTVSHGCAVNIADGVTAAVAESDVARVSLNGISIELPTVLRMVEALAPRAVSVSLTTPLAIGCGFGVSAAAALATAFAIDRRFELGRSRFELGMLAHVAEVECGTGVGDVAAQLCGGVVYRRCQSGPFDVERISLQADPLSYVVFGPLSTRDVLRAEETVQAIEREGRRACRWLESQRELSLSAILGRSREFVSNTGLLTDEVEKAIATATAYGQQSSMILLGQSAVACGSPPPGSDWVATSVDEQGTRLLL